MIHNVWRKDENELINTIFSPHRWLSGSPVPKTRTSFATHVEVEMFAALVFRDENFLSNTRQESRTAKKKRRKKISHKVSCSPPKELEVLTAQPFFAYQKKTKQKKPSRAQGLEKF